MAVFWTHRIRWSRILIDFVLCLLIVSHRARSRVLLSAVSTTVCYNDHVSVVCWYPAAASDKYFVNTPAWTRDNVAISPNDEDYSRQEINSTATRLTMTSPLTQLEVNTVGIFSCELVLKDTTQGTEKSNDLAITGLGILRTPAHSRSPTVSHTTATLSLRQDTLCFASHTLKFEVSWQSTRNSSDAQTVNSNTFNSSTANSVQVVLTGLSINTEYSVRVFTVSLSQPRIKSQTFIFTVTTLPSTDPPPPSSSSGLSVAEIAIIATSPVALIIILLILALCCAVCIRKCFICKTRYTLQRRKSRDVYRISNKTIEEMSKPEPVELCSPQSSDYAEVFWKGNTPIHRSPLKAIPMHMQTSNVVVEYAASAFSLNTEGVTAMTEALFKRKVTEAFDKAGIMLFSIQGVCFRQDCIAGGDCSCMGIQTFHPDIHGCFRSVTFVANCKLNSEVEPLEDSDIWDVTLAKGGLGTPKGFVISANEHINNRLFQVVEASGIHFVSCTGGCLVDGWAEHITREFKNFF